MTNAPLETFLNEIADLIGELIYRIRYNMGLIGPGYEKKPVDLAFGDAETIANAPKIDVRKTNLTTVYLPEAMRKVYFQKPIQIDQMRAVTALFMEALDNGIPFRNVTAFRDRTMFESQFTAPKSEMPGWLGFLTGYGMNVRDVSFRWLLKKGAWSSWDLTGSTTAKNAISSGKTDHRWIETRAEPPPPCSSLVPVLDKGYFDMHRYWLQNPMYGDNVYQQIVEPDFIYITKNTGQSIESYLDREYKVEGWTQIRDKWRWRGLDDWGFQYRRRRFSVINGREYPHDYVTKIPKWWDQGDRAYHNRLCEYYRNGYFLVWSGTVYCLHAGVKIPNWWREHAYFWGCPCPSEERIASKRLFVHSSIEGKPEPLSIWGDSAGYGNIPAQDVYDLLTMTMFHTPPPGSTEEIFNDERRALIDQPIEKLGGFSPSWKRPADWESEMNKRRQEQWTGSGLYKFYKIFSLVHSAAMSFAGGYGGSSIGELVKSIWTTALETAPGFLEVFEKELKDKIGESWYTVLTFATTLGCNAAKDLENVQQSLQQIEQFIGHNFIDNVTRFCGNRIAGMLASKAQLTKDIENQINNIVTNYKWDYVDDLMGNASDNFGALLDKQSAVEGAASAYKGLLSL